MKKICNKLVPKVLTNEQKQTREAILGCTEEDPEFLDNVITRDEI